MPEFALLCFSRGRSDLGRWNEKQVLPFHKIYFDSNLAIKEGWPRVSAAFKRTLFLAKTFETPVILLDVVESELEAHWVRQYRESLDAVADLQKLHEQIGLTVAPGLPELKEVRTAYRKAIDGLVSEHGFVRVRSQLRPTMQLFQMAIWEAKPFQKKGRNFQDAVICLAGIDDLAKDPTHTGAFLSRDSVFEQESLDALSRPTKVRLLLFPDLNQLSEVLKNELGERLRTSWDVDQKQAAKAIEENIEIVTAYLAKNLEIPANLGFGGEILSIEGIEHIRVLAVRTPAPWDRDSGKPFILTAELEVSLRAIVKSGILPMLIFQPPQVVRVGAESSPVQNPVLSSKQISAEPTEQLVSRTVQVEISATETDGRYTNLEPLSIGLK